jgi:hypothetical protein
LVRFCIDAAQHCSFGCVVVRDPSAKGLASCCAKLRPHGSLILVTAQPCCFRAPGQHLCSSLGHSFAA